MATTNAFICSKHKPLVFLITMTKIATTKEDILISLASKGDAAAFYSIAAPYFEIEYLNLRHNGSTHNDATEKILTDSSELFKKLLGTQPADFNDWFKSNSETSSDNSEEIALFSAETNLPAERNHFLHELQLHLLRTASEFNNKKRKKILLALRNPKLKLFSGIAAILILIITVFLFLHTTNSSVTLSYSSSDKEYKVTLGSKPKAFVPETTQVVVPPKADSVASEIKKADTLVVEKVEEKVPEKPPVKKVYRPKPVIVETHPTPSPTTDTEVSSPTIDETPSSQTVPAVQPITSNSVSEQSSD